LTELELIAAAVRAHFDLGNTLWLAEDVYLEESMGRFELVRNVDVEECDSLCSGSLNGCLRFAAEEGILKGDEP